MYLKSDIMKNLIYFTFVIFSIALWGCQEDQFADNYPDPSKIANTTIERQYTGVQVAGIDYVVPAYWNYFVVLRITLNPWTQSIGWINTPNQYIPGSAASDAVWSNYYGILAQYREFQKVWSSSTPQQQNDRKIFNLTAAAYLYYETQRMVDLFGSIPFFNAGMLSTNGGDYNVSFAEYDGAEEIYTYMLDELKTIATELNNISLNPGFQASFNAQDIINHGDVQAWKRFVNSLRLRMLNRVSLSPAFSSRASAEIAEILSNPSQFPIVTSNDEGIQIDVYDVSTPINSSGFQQGINSAGWDGDDASKIMIDFLNASSDPRLRVMFEPGTAANGVYVGLDPLLAGNTQQALVNDGEIAYYNRSTFSENQFFPGVLISASEVNFIKAEYYLRSGNDAQAKAAYEEGIRQSIDFYYTIRENSNSSVSGSPALPTEQEITNLLASAPVNWNGATSQGEKIRLIGMQKWLHFNIVQPYQNWAEVRRLNVPQLSFWVDNSSTQTQPPVRWRIPGEELTYNEANYDAVRSNDNLTTKIFWDVD